MTHPTRTPPPPPHSVCQVFCSALPLSYSKTTPSASWAPLARPVLDGAFEATLLVGSILARQRGTRVKVYLTGLGAGAFGNPSLWVCSALERALKRHLRSPIDVMLVHYHRQPSQQYQALERNMAGGAQDSVQM